MEEEEEERWEEDSDEYRQWLFTQDRGFSYLQKICLQSVKNRKEKIGLNKKKNSTSINKNYKGEFMESNVVTICVNFIGCFIYCVKGNELWKDYLCMYFKMLF